MSRSMYSGTRLYPCKPTTQPEEADAWTGSRRKPHCDQPPTKTKSNPQGQLQKEVAAIFGSYYLEVQSIHLNGPVQKK